MIARLSPLWVAATPDPTRARRRAGQQRYSVVKDRPPGYSAVCQNPTRKGSNPANSHDLSPVLSSPGPLPFRDDTGAQATTVAGAKRAWWWRFALHDLAVDEPAERAQTGQRHTAPPPGRGAIAKAVLHLDGIPELGQTVRVTRPHAAEGTRTRHPTPPRSLSERLRVQIWVLDPYQLARLLDGLGCALLDFGLRQRLELAPRRRHRASRFATGAGANSAGSPRSWPSL